jgi:hypothetical protein
MPEQLYGASRICGPDVPEQARRILLVGEANPYGADPNYALYHLPERAAGARLQGKILGLPAREWYLPIWRANLCTGTWDRGEAADRAGELLTTDAPWRVIVMLGRQVNRAFAFHTGQDGLPFTSYTSARPAQPPMEDRRFTLVSLPHPSGRNTVWSDPAAGVRARAVMAEVAPEIPWGSL